MTPTVPGDLSKWTNGGRVDFGWAHRVFYNTRDGHNVEIGSDDVGFTDNQGRPIGRAELVVRDAKGHDLTIEMRVPGRTEIDVRRLVLKAAIAIGLVTASDEGKVGG